MQNYISVLFYRKFSSNMVKHSLQRRNIAEIGILIWVSNVFALPLQHHI